MLALLLGGGAVYLLLGDLQEALILLAFATLSVGITIIQESRTERVLEALRDLTSPRALVIREGERKRILLVARWCAAIWLCKARGIGSPLMLLKQSADLQVDESSLTGESVPVRKIAVKHSDQLADQRPGGDDLPFAFSGSLVVCGSGIGEVLATGPLSQIGAIGHH